MRGYVEIDPKALRELRRDRLLSTRQLAKLADVSPDTVNSLELGKRDAQTTTVKKLASALRVRPQRLII